MVWENPQNIEKSIRRSKRELDALDKFLYGRHEADDRHLYAGTLQQKKTDVVRATVLHMHTAIENIITQGLFEAILGAEYGKAYKKLRSQRGQALARMLEGAGSLGFDMKLNFAVIVGIIQPKMREKLRELNTLRNRCSHNWLLDVPIRRKRKPSQPKLMLLNFRGRSLYKVETLEEFMAEFGHLYYLIYGTVTKEARMAAARESPSRRRRNK